MLPDMYRRLDIVDGELDQSGYGITRRTGSCWSVSRDRADIDALKALADVVEPGTLGLRHHVNPDYAQSTPLNRLVDAARPDSEVARHFSALVDRYLANRSDNALHD